MASQTSRGSGAAYQVDQAVHGYDLGHRLLATSSAAVDASEQLMGAMSDLLTTRLLEANGSYLVGYPVKSKNFYVIARTWAAREMPRPGSVWTHSLILDYQTLAVLQDPVPLLDQLRRPTTSSLSSYVKPIVVEPGPRAKLERLSRSSARAALATLYSGHADRDAMLASSSRENDEQLLLTLWRQMWPALRRDTAFFSFVDDVPPPIDASCIIRFSRSVSTMAVPPEGSGALDALLIDLPHRDQTKLRSFLARHAFDARDPRGAVLPLVRLSRDMDDGDRAAALQAFANVLPLANPSRLLRSVLGRFFEHEDPSRALLDIVERFGELSVSATSDWLPASRGWVPDEDLGLLLSRSARCAVGTLGFAIFSLVAGAAPIDALSAASYDEQTAQRLLEERPALLDAQPFWQKQGRTQPKLIKYAAAIGRPFESVLTLARRDLSPESVAALIDCWPERIIDLAGSSANAPDGLRLVAAVLSRSPTLLERVVATNLPISMDLLEELVVQGFKANAIPCPPKSAWGRLSTPDDPHQTPNLAVLTLVAVMSATRRMTPSDFSSLMTAVRQLLIHERLLSETRRYLEKALRALGIYRWSIVDALNEALVLAFTTGDHVSIEILNATNRQDFDGLLGAVYNRLGLSELRDLRIRAARSGDAIDSWQMKHLDEFIRNLEPKWFW